MLKLYEAKEKPPYILESIRSLMGTSVAMAIVHSDVDRGKEAMKLAFEEMSRIEDLMSVYKESSEVSSLNKNGFYEGASADTIYVIEKAKDYARLSKGAFSTAVPPLLELWRRRADVGEPPSEKEIGEVLELVDDENIVVEGGDITLKKVGMGITLGGIAKGYAVDKAIETLRENGVEHALVNAGGDIMTLGDKLGGVPWRIALRDPRDKRRSITVVGLRDRAIATSGNYEREHILDPRSGYPVRGLLGASVITDKAIDADALSTTVFVLGEEAGREFVERFDGVEYHLVTGDGKILRSTGFR